MCIGKLAYSLARCPQSCPKRAAAPGTPQRRFVALPVLGACGEAIAEAGDDQPGSRAHSKHYGTNARMIPGFTIERRRTE